MPGPSQRPVCANLRAPVAPAHLAPGQPRVWSWNLAQSLWGGFGLAPPVGSWLLWRADATGEDSWGWQLMPPPTPHNILPPSLYKEYFSNAWPGQCQAGQSFLKLFWYLFLGCPPTPRTCALVCVCERDRERERWRELPGHPGLRPRCVGGCGGVRMGFPVDCILGSSFVIFVKIRVLILKILIF